MGDTDPSLPAPLIAAVRDKNLLIVCGAGVSVAPPSSLPSWWGFNNALFEGLRAEAAKALPDLADAVMARPLEGRAPVTAFSELVVSTFAGDGYFPLLTALEGAKPNANHFALAALARQGLVADIVTFNFDTLIEQAFRLEKTPLQVMVRPGDYDQPQIWGGGARLHKVHGSVTDAATLIDTVTQKLKGLAVGRRDRLQDVFSRRHILFLGFSGADFDFGSDYLPMSANAAGGFGFTWLHRGASPPALADCFTDPAGTFVSGELPAFLSRLGLEIAPSTLAVSTTVHALAERVQTWVSGPTVGPWSSAAFMHAFAEKQQDEALLIALSTGLETAVRDALIAGRAEISMSGCVRRVALAAMHRGDFNRALAWSAQELQFHEATWTLLTKDGAVAPRPEVRLEHLRNTASIYVNMALALLHGTTPDHRTQAKALLLEANARARAARDHRLLALIQFNLAKHIETRPDASLMALRAAQAAAREAGSGRTLVEAAFFECKTLIGLSELDLAEAVVQTIRPLLTVVGEAGEIWEAALRRALIAVRRGNFEAAMVACEAVGQTDPVGEDRRSRIARRMRQLFSSRPELHARLSTLLFDLGDPDPLAVEAFMPFALVASGDNAEDELRRTIAAAEHQQRHDILVKAFEQLGRLQHDRHAWARLADVAFALLRAAERAGALDSLLVAHQYRGIASEMLGDLDTASAGFIEAMRLCDVSGLCPGAQRANLAGVVWRLGEPNRAQSLYREAQDELHAARDWRQLSVATINFGRKLVEAGRADEAADMV
ncbi:SIR2 family protein [uncultured Rhodoblastus sp.]|uniref:SIR2 family protein n=1 Tax=uncultured Rhodoblastus sp. TaxID=543037 RepID=UPI0025F63BA2|nr:SIR2 family protein [uncultured Rhodoblastus sp.]